MQVVTLTYGSTSQDFNVFGYKVLDYDIERVVHLGLNGGRSEEILGYRRILSLDFMPLLGNKTLSFFMEAFLLSNDRSATIDGVTYTNLTIDTEELGYTFFDGVRFANSFTLTLGEGTLNATGDDDSTLVLKPLYFGEDSAAGSFLVQLVDVDSTKYFRENFSFIGGNKGDATFGFIHKFSVQFLPITDPTKQSWLLNWTLWKNKQLDLSAIEPVYYPSVMDVILDERSNQIRWVYSNNVLGNPMIKLDILETSLRTAGETP